MFYLPQMCFRTTVDKNSQISVDITFSIDNDR